MTTAAPFRDAETRAFVQAHHVRHWEHGGATDLDNLVLVCHFHHKLVHELGWSVCLDRSTAQWFRPGGKRYNPGPDPPEPPPLVGQLIASSSVESDELAAAV